MADGKILFKPYFVQKGRGPHLFDFVMTLDEFGDAFHSDIKLTNAGIQISDTEGRNKFSISVRWNVEGYGYLFIPADNEGNYYELPKSGTLELNLNYEVAKTRVYRNAQRRNKFESDGWKSTIELKHHLDLSEELLNDARRYESSNLQCAEYSQKSVAYSTNASEMMEIEKARFDISRNRKRDDFYFGCDSRGYFQMESPKLFMERFNEAFNYATVTHYLKGDFIDFEPEEGNKKFSERLKLIRELRKNQITVEGRPLFWTHNWVTPEWLKKKTYFELLKYVEKHVREVVGFYKDEIEVWEVVNEMHDWANEVQLNHKQTIELTKLACDVARDTTQRTPHQFTKQIIEAGVDFDIIGVQVYFVHHTLTEALQSIERYEKMGKAVQLAEIGAPSYGITQEFTEAEEDFSQKPYEWHRHWDEELQADWLESIFTYAYSKKFIEAANWYDFVDPFGFLKKGGILRSPKGEKKAAFDRLISLKNKWNSL
ncbi:MAG: endo-1,4-beta-xylanase [Ignavibacteriaceae bacterium]|nr:endo-1,4-beta-xylanase [Ignavibacteriaceae bacterium]